MSVWTIRCQSGHLSSFLTLNESPSNRNASSQIFLTLSFSTVHLRMLQLYVNKICYMSNVCFHEGSDTDTVAFIYSCISFICVQEKASALKTESPTPSKKVENLRGCDLLQEVSVTIRRFKKTSILKERSEKSCGTWGSVYTVVIINTNLQEYGGLDSDKIIKKVLSRFIIYYHI